MPAWHERRRFCVEFVVIAAIALVTLSATPARAADPVIAAAGDIACSSAKASGSGCHQQATSDLLVGAPLRGVLTLGDNQYESGALPAYNQFYNASWGRVKAITHPSVGNHEYGTKGAS